MANVNGYVQLTNVGGSNIKPITDLSAINMTTSNGIVVEPVGAGTISIEDGYIEQTYYNNMISQGPNVGPATPQDTYVDGGTMYTLLGGYAVSDEVPSINADPYKVPSEVAVRAAIDAYVATGGTDIVPGKAINVSGGSINVTTAEVKDVLDETTPVDTKAVTPEALLGALSVGQAVDVSCAPYTNTGTITYGAGGFLDGFTVTMVSGTTVGFYDKGSHSFPKFAKDGNNNPLHYIFIADVSGTGAITPNGYNAITLSNTPQRISTEVTAEDTGWFSAAAAATVNVANWRQYEVTALTAAAKEYIASAETNPDPDVLFRSTNAYSILNKYLIKQDMVSPFIPIINMDNKNVTIGAGLAYSVKLTDGQNHDFTVDTIPANGYGWDSHLQLFIAGTAGATFVPPLALMDPLTPNAGHNITIKWRAGQALAYVDDTDIGYVVSIQSGTENGTLYYGLKNETGEYVVFAGSLDGQVIEVTGDDALVTRNTRLIGNGIENTIISGTMGATSGKTINFQDLSISGCTFGGSGDINYNNIAFNNTNVLSAPLEYFNSTTINGTVLNSGRITFTDSNSLEGTMSGGVIVCNPGAFLVSRNSTGVIDGSISTSPVIVGNYSWGSDSKDTVISGVTITGFTTATALEHRNEKGRAILNNCFIIDNSNRAFNLLARDHVEFHNCYVSNNSSFTFVNSVSKCNVSIIDCYLDSSQTVNMRSGTVNIKGGTFKTYVFNDTYGNADILTVNIVASTITLLGAGQIGNSNSYAHTYIGSFSSPDDFSSEFSIGGEATFITDNNTMTISGCEFSGIVGGRIYGVPSIIVGSMDVWKATNVIFASPLDAHEASTVKLTGTTFTTTAKTLNASRIQLPASTTVSFQGNTNDANTKILDASLIVVGDNPASPSGTATVVNASGTSSTVTGIGTYIDKEGDNDFVANNTTNVVPVDASTTGAKYLGTVLSATTGETGANKFAKIDSGEVAVVNEATNAVNKQIITHDYEPILGGTFSLTSATVNEATKTTTILEGGTMSIVAVRGGKDNVIDLGGTNVGISSGTTASYNGCVFTNGGGDSDGYGGAIRVRSGRKLVVDNCIISGNNASSRGGAIFNAGNLDISNSVISGNRALLGAGLDLNAGAAATHISGSTIADNYNLTDPPLKKDILLYGGHTMYIDGGCTMGVIDLGTIATLNIGGSNTFVDYVSGTSPNAVVNISAGAVLDLTGNTNATPIAPGGSITFEAGGATVYPSAGSASAMVISGLSFTAASLSNNNVINLSGVTPGIAFKSADAFVSGGTFTGMTAYPAFVCNSNGSLTLNNCVVSGNTCAASNGTAGGVDMGYQPNGVLTLSNTTISGNFVSGTNTSGLPYSSGYDIFGGNTAGTVNMAGGATVGRIMGGVQTIISNQNNTIMTITNYGSFNGKGVIFSAGASLQLNGTIQNQTNGITVKAGGCTVNGKVLGNNSTDTVYSKIQSSGGRLYVDGVVVP